MAFVFRVPDVGEGLAEAEIIEWRVAVGDVVTMDQIVVEVETDKAVVEIPVPVAGTVLHLGAGDGETVAVGSVLMVVGAADETWEPESVDAPGPASADEPDDAAAHDDEYQHDEYRDDEEVSAVSGRGAGSTADVAPIVGTLDSEATFLEASGSSPSDSADAVRALPVVRKLARDLGVDLHELQGTGPDGRITRHDVTTAAERSPEPRVPDHPGGGPEPTVGDEPLPDAELRAGDDTGGSPEPRVPDHPGRRRMSRVRRTIAERMSRSWAEIPHVTTFDEVDATRLFEVRTALNKRTGATIPMDALVVKAIVPALAAHPDFNARLDGEELIDPDTLDIGVAVDTPDGLMVVVVRDAAARTLTEVASEIVRLAAAAKDRKTTPEEMSGQTFTVSNIGAVGGGYGTPIVPYGTIGILSVGRAVDRPVARNGRVTIAPTMPLSLSYDHRVIDGGEARRFIAHVVENLTEPALFLAD
jgi:pyruvate/2-oxoglutarate dehydrogenase complex dihydrolipoamide acyltransferase (E2) component